MAAPAPAPAPDVDGIVVVALVEGDVALAGLR